ncbi:MAG: TolB family protein [Bacteroidota bacterium]
MKPEEGERAHLTPRVLPGGTHALFTIWTGAAFEDAQIGVVDLSTGEHQVILRGGADARYLTSGHLVYARGATIMAAPFDPSSLRVTGEGLPMMDNVRFSGDAGTSFLTTAMNGTIGYVPGTVIYTPTTISLYEGERKIREIRSEGKALGDPMFAPDGRRLGLTIFGTTYHQAAYDLHRDILTQLTSSADNWRSVWRRDASSITFSSNLSGRYYVYTVPADGSGPPEKLFEQEGNPYPGSWTPDDGMLAYVVMSKETQEDVWVHSKTGEQQLRPVIQSPAMENSPRISPDGRWIAYVSNESGQNEVYVRPFPEGAGKWRMSNGRGLIPRWAPDGKRLYFAREDRILSVSVSIVSKGNSSAMDIGREEQVLSVNGLTGFDISPNGRTFVVAQQGVGTLPDKLHLVLNWFEELKVKVPAK